MASKLRHAEFNVVCDGRWGLPCIHVQHAKCVRFCLALFKAAPDVLGMLGTHAY